MEGGEDLHSSYIVNCVLNAFFCYTAIILNSVTIYALRNTSSLPKPLKTMLLSLAVSDLGAGLLAQPLYIALFGIALTQNIENNRTYNTTYIAFITMLNTFSPVSFTGVMALTVDRFLAIHLHLRYQELVTHKRVVAVVISKWVFCALISFIRLWIPENISYAIYSILFVSSLLTTTSLYFKIYAAVRRHANQIQAQQVAQNGERENAARQRKFAVGTFFVYLVFLLCYLPNTCTFIAIIISGRSTTIQIWRFYTLTLMFLNSSLNPLIYCWKMRHIRRAVIETLRNILRSPLNNSVLHGEPIHVGFTIRLGCDRPT